MILYLCRKVLRLCADRGTHRRRSAQRTLPNHPSVNATSAARGRPPKSPSGVAPRPRRARASVSEHGQVELLLDRDPAELHLRTRLDLADAFLGDPQLAAELFQGLLAGAVDAVAADDDPPLAVVEPAEHP